MKLSWKYLLPIGIIIWLIGKFMDSVLGGAIALIGIIMLVLGIVDAIRTLSKGKKKDENEQAE